MLFALRSFLITLLASGVAAAQEQNASDTLLNRYFESYCDYTGGLGIRFVASHTYDYEFRQRLKKTEDRELKRLFVLKNLYRDVDNAVSSFEEGLIEVGKSMTRKMTSEERTACAKRISQQLDDLLLFDPGDPQREIAQHRRKIGPGR